MPELYHLPSDPSQTENLVHKENDLACELHKKLVGFTRDASLSDHLLKPWLELML